MITLKSLLLERYLNEDIYDDYVEIEEEVQNEFHRGVVYQSWKLVPIRLLIPAWAKFTKYGRIDEEELNKIWNILKESVIKIIINSEIKDGYSAPSFFYKDEYEEITEEEWDRWFKFVSDRSGSNYIRNSGEVEGNARYSDQSRRLFTFLEKCYNAKTPEELFININLLLNFVHGLGNMAKWFVEGGVNTLNKLDDLETKGIRVTGNISEQILSELITVNLAYPNASEDSRIAAWRDKLFIFNLNDHYDNIFNKLKDHFYQHPQLTPSSTNHILSIDDLYDTVRSLPDTITGHWYKENNTLVLDHTTVSPTTSLLLKKIVRQLHIKNIEVSDDMQSKVYNIRQIKGTIPDILYHGTTSLYLENILYNGLQPTNVSGVKSNWNYIEHPEVVFLSAVISEAFFYSTNAFRNRKSGYPIVIEVKIPDKNLIIPDYDADPYRKTPQYQSYKQFAGGEISMRPSAMSLHSGKFGYLGSIPPRYIQGVYFLIGKYGHDYKKIKIKSLRKFLQKYDIETLAYKIDATTLNSHNYL